MDTLINMSYHSAMFPVHTVITWHKRNKINSCFPASGDSRSRTQDLPLSFQTSLPRQFLPAELSLHTAALCDMHSTIRDFSPVLPEAA